MAATAAGSCALLQKGRSRSERTSRHKAAAVLTNADLAGVMPLWSLHRRVRAAAGPGGLCILCLVEVLATQHSFYTSKKHVGTASAASELRAKRVCSRGCQRSDIQHRCNGGNDE
jgi:hypothetical protein